MSEKQSAELADPSKSSPTLPESKNTARSDLQEEINAQPAQVTPALKKKAQAHPEDVPPPGDMGPGEGPSS